MKAMMGGEKKAVYVIYSTHSAQNGDERDE
jgi:hypothetical protein